jgi:hypothetical protein
MALSSIISPAALPTEVAEPKGIKNPSKRQKFPLFLFNKPPPGMEHNFHIYNIRKLLGIK